MGYCINEEFIRRFLAAFGVCWLSECEGQIFVEHSWNKIYRLIPLKTSHDAKEFDIQAWLGKEMPKRYWRRECRRKGKKGENNNV